MGKPNQSNLAGMTINERLVTVGIVDRWDAAVKRRDRAAMLAILEQVEVAQPEVTVDAVLASPWKFGFD